MSKKKKIKLLIITILIIIIISFIVPVKSEIEGYKYGNGEFDISNPETFDYTIYAYKNIYGITLKTSYSWGIGVEITN